MKFYTEKEMKINIFRDRLFGLGFLFIYFLFYFNIKLNNLFFLSISILMFVGLLALIYFISWHYSLMRRYIAEKFKELEAIK